MGQGLLKALLALDFHLSVGNGWGYSPSCSQDEPGLSNWTPGVWREEPGSWYGLREVWPPQHHLPMWPSCCPWRPGVARRSGGFLGPESVFAASLGGGRPSLFVYVGVLGVGLHPYKQVVASMVLILNVFWEVSPGPVSRPCSSTVILGRGALCSGHSLSPQNRPSTVQSWLLPTKMPSGPCPLLFPGPACLWSGGCRSLSPLRPRSPLCLPLLQLSQGSKQGLKRFYASWMGKRTMVWAVRTVA